MVASGCRSGSHCTPLITVSSLVCTNAAGRGTPQRSTIGGSPQAATYGEIDWAGRACWPPIATGRCEITAGQPRAAAVPDGGAATLTGPRAAPLDALGGTADGAGRVSAVWLRASTSSTVTGTATAVATSAARRRCGSIAVPCLEVHHGAGQGAGDPL